MATGLATTLPSSPAPWAARPAHGRPLAHGPAGISPQTECRGTPRGRPAALPAISESVYASRGLGAPPENCRLACASPHSEGEFWNGPMACSRQASVCGRGEAPTQDCPLAACPVPPPMLRVCPVALLVTPWATERSGQLCGVSAGPHEGGRHGVPWPDGTPTSLAFLGSFLYVLMSPQAERLVLSKEYFLKPKMIPKAHKKKK